MNDETWLVVTLAGSGDTGSWVGAYLPKDILLHVAAVSERHVEDEARELVRSMPSARCAVVTIDQRFMGFLAKRAIDTLDQLGVSLPALIHPRACVASGVTLGVGARIGAGAIVGEGCILAAHTRVLEGAVLGRDCNVDPFSTIDPGVILGDSVHVGAHSWLRAGVVLEARTVIGASSELSVPGSYRGVVVEGTQQLAGLDGPARILRFG